MQTFENLLLLLNYSTKFLVFAHKYVQSKFVQMVLYLHFVQNNNQRQFEHRKFNANCYGSLLGNRLVNLGISKQQHLYLKTKNLI